MTKISIISSKERYGEAKILFEKIIKDFEFLDFSILKRKITKEEETVIINNDYIIELFIWTLAKRGKRFQKVFIDKTFTIENLMEIRAKTILPNRKERFF